MCGVVSTYIFCMSLYNFYVQSFCQSFSGFSGVGFFSIPSHLEGVLKFFEGSNFLDADVSFTVEGLAACFLLNLYVMSFIR